MKHIPIYGNYKGVLAVLYLAWLLVNAGVVRYFNTGILLLAKRGSFVFIGKGRGGSSTLLSNSSV